MGNKYKIIAAAVVCIVVMSTLCTLLVGCADIGDIYKIDSTNYGKYAKYQYDNGASSMNFSLRGEGGEWVEVSWTAPVTFNTIVLKEKGEHVTQFELYVGQDLVYRQDEIGSLRTIYLGEITTSSIKLVVNSSDGAYRLTEMGIYYVEQDHRMSVTDAYYLDENSANYLNPNSNFAAMNSSTDVVLVGSVLTYDETGSIVADNGKLKEAITTIKRAAPKVKVHVLLSAGTDEDSDKVRLKAMSENKTDFAQNIVELVTLCGADGVVFDFINRGTVFDNDKYNSFIEFIRGLLLSPKKLGVMTESDDHTFNDASKRYVDDFYVIAHDIGDYSDNPASFKKLCEVLVDLKATNFPRAKISVTVPLYGRSVGSDEDMRGEKFSYADNYSVLGKWGNTLTKDDTTIYFNGYASVKDKAAFIYGFDIGGVMLVDYDCDVSYDNALSLHRAVQEAIK